MNKCSCYYEEERVYYDHMMITSRTEICGFCNGTKEREQCLCDGDRTKCDFYPEVIEKALKELEPKFGEWISVKDRLPDKSRQYLTYDSRYEDIDIYYYIGHGEWDHHRHGITDAQSHGFTHWQPLPKPPKGE